MPQLPARLPVPAASTAISSHTQAPVLRGPLAARDHLLR